MREEDLSYFEDEEFKEHLAQYEQMRQGGMPAYLDSDELTDIAEFYMSNLREVEAMNCIEYAIQLHPGSTDPIVFKARQYLFAGELEITKQLRDQITNQDDREVVFLNAEIILRENDAMNASAYLQNFSERITDGLNDFVYDVASIFADYAQYNIALEWTNWFMQISPESNKGKILLAELYTSTSEAEKAILILNEVLDSNPYSHKAWTLMANAQLMIKDYSGAIESCDFALAIDEDNLRILLSKALGFFYQNNFEEAHQIYKEYIHMNPEDEIAYVYNGLCLFCMERYDEAIAMLESADEMSLELSPEQFNIYLYLAISYSKMHLLPKAIELLERAKELEPPKQDMFILEAYMYLENNKKRSARKCFKKAIKISEEPDTTTFLIYLSLLEYSEYDQVNKLLDEQIKDVEQCEKKKAYISQALYAKLADKHEEYLNFLKLACENDSENHPITIDKALSKMNPDDFYLYAINKLRNE